MNRITNRIAAVEREIVRCRNRARRAEVGLAVVVIGLFVVGMASKGKPEEITATSFKLLTSEGDVIAVLGPNQYSQPGLHFYQTNNDQEAVASYSGYGVQLAGKEQNSHLTHSELVITAERAQVMLRAVSLKNQYGGMRCGNSPPPPHYEGGVAWMSLRGDSKNRAVLMAHTNGTTSLTLSARDKGTIAIDHTADSTDRDWDRVWEAPPPTDPVTGGSTLPGVHIEFTMQRKTWTTAEARSGLKFEYVIKVDREIEGVQPEPIDAGGCGVPGPSGLILLETIEGNDQRYCVCDVGICVPEPYDYSTLHPGEYAGSFEWDGRNWNGPSDTEVPKGERFPPGQYSLTLKAVGNRRVAGEETDFIVVGVFEFDLTCSAPPS